MAVHETQQAPIGARPRFADEWEDIAQLVRWLRDRRESHDPKLVITGKMNEEEAARRKRIIAALDSVWQAIVARAPMPVIDADWAELSEDCRMIAERPYRAGDPHPCETGESFDALRNALAWQMTIDPGRIEPRIVFVARINEAVRRERAKTG
jgi:hypothetical protein